MFDPGKSEVNEHGERAGNRADDDEGCEDVGQMMRKFVKIKI